VETITSSEKVDIRYESELVYHFRQQLTADPDLRWSIPHELSVGERLPWVELKLDDHQLRFKPVYSRKPSLPELESLLADWHEPLPPLLVSPELVPKVLDFCRDKRLAAIALNGQIYLRSAGVLIDRQPLPGRDFRFELEPRNIFVGKSARIIRTLLTDRDRIWTQSELGKRTLASSGLVSRIVQHLISQGLLEKQSPRQFRLREPFELIDAWVKADDLSRRTIVARYTIFESDPLALARKLTSWAESHSVKIAFTQWVAAWLRHPYTEPVISSAYVSRLPSAADLEELGLRRVTDAGKVWLFVPDDERGFFRETKTVNELPLISDAQIYLDLQGTGLRGPEQAEALRNWEGFCRP
jgi:hypothetical protein